MRLNEERQLSSPDSEWPLTRTSNESDRTLFLRRMMAALFFVSYKKKICISYTRTLFLNNVSQNYIKVIFA